jgi:hypothetical protein
MCGYWMLFHLMLLLIIIGCITIGYLWLLVTILLMIIDDYWLLLMVILLVVIGHY